MRVVTRRPAGGVVLAVAGPDVSEGRRLACGRGALVEIRVAPRDRLRGGEDVPRRRRVGLAEPACTGEL